MNTNDYDWIQNYVRDYIESNCNSLKRGLVTSINLKEHMVKVDLALEGVEQHWCRIVESYVGNDFGMRSLPQVDEEVLVAFIDGDINHPVVIGKYYNKVDQPPKDPEFKDPDEVLFKHKSGSLIKWLKAGQIWFKAIKYFFLKGLKEVYIEGAEKVVIKDALNVHIGATELGGSLNFYADTSVNWYIRKVPGGGPYDEFKMLWANFYAFKPILWVYSPNAGIFPTMPNPETD
jgi:phage baseplate assembly protein gpV